jgi:acetoin utilization protein AcuB
VIVGMWMSRNLVCCNPGEPICSAARVMSDNGIRRLPVVQNVDGELRLIGVVSATDLYRAFPANCNPFGAAGLSGGESALEVRQIMTQSVITTSPDTPLEEAARILRDRKIGALPVVSGSRLVGMITESDIFKALINLLQGNGTFRRVTFTASRQEDLFALLAAEVTRRDVHVQSFLSWRVEGQTMCSIGVSGADVDGLVQELWQSGHPVMNVSR